jgi:hypothetical protein
MSDGPLPNPITIAEFGTANMGRGMRRLQTTRQRSPRISLEYDIDGIHDGLVFLTEEERATLRRVPGSIPWDAYRKPFVSLPSMLSFLTELFAVIAFVELAERFSVCCPFLYHPFSQRNPI